MELILKHIRQRLEEHHFHFEVKIDHPITGIYGPSGAGKTTLLNVIAGIEKPREGSIVFNGTTLFDAAAHINIPTYKRRLGVVFQDNYLFPHLSVKQNLNYSLPYLKGNENYVDFNQVIALLEIDDLLDKKPLQLSGGERQRVAIGRALLAQPELLLFDEPFSNLDREKRKQIISYLLKINSVFNVPLLIISHDLEDILKLTRQLLVIKEGKVAASGNYLSISEEGKVPDIINHKRFLNVVEGIFDASSGNNRLVRFISGPDATEYMCVTATSEMLSADLKPGQRVRLSIHPDEIALAIDRFAGTSIQNQLKGTITHIQERGNSFFVTVDCGFKLVSEVTLAAIEKLDLKVGKIIYCLVKSKAIEVVHTYASKS